jgi:nucleotide-binding universal stress UspA family protein
MALRLPWIRDMAKRILVPISPRMPSDPFMTVLGDLARGAGATVRLLHVAASPTNVVDEDGRIVAYADQERFRLHTEGHDLLQVVNLTLGGESVEVGVRFGDPVTEILAEAADFGADLIVLGTGDRRRFPFRGGVAWEVLHRTEVPIALLRSSRREGAA